MIMMMMIIIHWMFEILSSDLKLNVLVDRTLDYHMDKDYLYFFFQTAYPKWFCQNIYHPLHTREKCL